MPELPEVEIMTRNVDRWCRGKTLARAELLDPGLGIDLSGVIGAQLGAPVRRGKYLCLPLAGQLLILHFRMTGKVVVEADGPRPHARLRLHLGEGEGEGAPIAFVDTRRLGCAWLIPAQEADAFFAAIPLGPEPWPEPRDGAWWQARLAGLRGPLKSALMNQRRVAGLGNIAASEICFRSRLDPRSPVPALGAADLEAVAQATPAFIGHVLAEESGPEIAYINESRDAPNPFAVYAREGERCVRCVGTVRRIVQAGRATFFCPGCQHRR